MSRALTLLSDYGTRDGYVGALKAAIASHAPAAVPLDLTHEIPAQDVLAGAVALLVACRAFPADSVHLAVVDPEVGTSRAGLLVRSWNQWFVAPDSGVLHFPLQDANARIWRLHPPPSRTSATTTFDGRDWFAPVAAQVWSGAAADTLGTPTTDVVELAIPAPVYEPYRWVGHVLHVDRYGNVISDLPAPAADARGTARVFVRDEPIGPVRAAYADAAAGQPVATIGALATIEVGIAMGHAQSRFSVRRGDRVEVLFPASQATPDRPW